MVPGAGQGMLQCKLGVSVVQRVWVLKGEVRMGTRTALKPSFVRFEISNLRCPKSCSSFGRREDMALPTPLTAASLGRNVPLEKPFLT